MNISVVQELLTTEPTPFKGMSGKTLPKKHGIYLIINNRTGEYLYAGKSDRAKNGLQSRIWEQHRTLTESSDLARILMDDQNIIEVQTPAQARQWMEHHCVVHYLTKEQLRIKIDRAEHLVITTLRPKYNKQSLR